jgi:hypothetical protein
VKAKLISVLFLLLFPQIIFAAYYELAFDFGYEKQIYGATRENSLVSRNYSGGLSLYLFDLTAIDLTYSSTQETTTINDRYTIQAGYDVVNQQNRVLTDVYGVGIKQMFAARGARLTPVLSIGYAREFDTSDGDITIETTASGAKNTYKMTKSKAVHNSMFGAFTLQLRLTDRFSLKGSVKSLFPAFEFNKAKDNLKYLVGFSWVF